jgi:hypothetical protein
VRQRKGRRLPCWRIAEEGPRGNFDGVGDFVNGGSLMRTRTPTGLSGASWAMRASSAEVSIRSTSAKVRTSSSRLAEPSSREAVRSRGLRKWGSSAAKKTDASASKSRGSMVARRLRTSASKSGSPARINRAQRLSRPSARCGVPFGVTLPPGTCRERFFTADNTTRSGDRSAWSGDDGRRVTVSGSGRTRQALGNTQ